MFPKHVLGTSNLAADQHAELYKTLRKNLPPTTGVLSVSHNTEKLAGLHDVHYNVKEGISTRTFTND